MISSALVYVHVGKWTNGQTDRQTERHTEPYEEAGCKKHKVLTNSIKKLSRI